MKNCEEFVARNAGHPSPDHGLHFFQGLIWAVVFSVPLWALMVWVAIRFCV